MKKIMTALVAISMLVVAGPAGAVTPSPPPSDGLSVTQSTFDFDMTWANLVGALEANPNIAVVSVVDHAAAAAGAGLALDPNRVVFFGNPMLGTPLMQSDRGVAIDLPQKIQVFELHGDVFVAYNPAAYLAARHDVSGVPTLDVIDGALANLVSIATGAEPNSKLVGLNVVERYPRLATVASANDFEGTWSNLLSAIEASPANVGFIVDHAANAAAAGLDLDPTRLAVFGNPNIGTPLMQARSAAGIDLPLKILVWEDGEGVHVTYSEPGYLWRRHHIPGQRPLIETISGALQGLVDAAAAPQVVTE
jgi:uncharacterized protein (DUF302 family)